MTNDRPFQKPRALAPGDLIAIAAPANAMSSSKIRYATRWLEGHRFRVRVSPEVERARWFTTADDQARAANLMKLAGDPEVAAILCAKGGYGTVRLLRFLDPAPFRERAPLVMGYSDVTQLLIWLLVKANLVTIHGPMARSLEPGLHPETERSILHALTSSEPWGPLGVGYCRVVVEGKARGPLVGGNASMLAQTLGTPYQVPAEGCILFLEDAYGDEEDIEHAIFHLKTAGILDQAAGFVLGELSDKEDDAEELEQVFLDLVGRDRPVIVGMPSGHTEPNLALPIGVEVEIDTSVAPTVKVVEAPAGSPRVSEPVLAGSHGAPETASGIAERSGAALPAAEAARSL